MRRLVGGIAVVAAAATACGSGSTGSSGVPDRGDALRVIRTAAASTAAQKSMQVRGTISEHLVDTVVRPGADPVSVDISMSMAGAIRTEPLQARLTISDINTGGQSVPGDITELVTPRAFYMNMPALAARTGKPWIKMTYADLKSASGIDLKQLMSQAQQMQPSQYIEQLAAAGHVREVGKEPVNGTATTHYAGTVSISDALAQYPAATRAQLAPVMRSAGFTGLDLDIWLDGDGLVRRIHSASVGGNGSVTVAMDVSAYGVSVNVTPPPADQTVDLGQLMAGQGG